MACARAREITDAILCLHPPEISSPVALLQRLGGGISKDIFALFADRRKIVGHRCNLLFISISLLAYSYFFLIPSLPDAYVLDGATLWVPKNK